MKIQNFLITLVICLYIISSSYAQCPGGGELKICVENPTSNKFYLSINSDGYSWDYNNSQVVIVNNYERSVTVTSGNYRFDSPNDKGSNIDTIPWGKFKIKIVSFDSFGLARFSKSFYLNLKDENWSKGATYSDYQRDTWIIIDQSANDGNGSIYLRGFSRNGTELTRYIADYDSNSTINIWTFMGIDSPNTSNFKVPITLFNKIENTDISFGYLNANGQQVFSGSDEPFKYNTVQTVTQGTLEKYTDVRNYSFKWSNSDYITPQTDQNFYTGIFNFTTVVDQQLKSITRNFRPVYPLTIKNISPESGSTNSFGEVLFKDPTTDNQFHSYLAIGANGFEKDNTFKDLDIEVGDLQNQKYSFKAISPISYNGRNYYWQSGDFNPTNQTDLLITIVNPKNWTKI